MGIENNMNEILNKRKSLNLNDDYGIQKSWNQIIEVLVENERNTIKYLKNCSMDK